MKKILSLGVVLLIASLYALLCSPGPLLNKRSILVARGSTRAIAKTLYDTGAIYNEHLFWIAAQTAKRITGSELKAGEYSLNPHASILETIRKLQSGDVVVRKIIVPEGSTNKQIQDLIDTAAGLKGVLKISLGEGKLLPQTYFYTYGDTKNDVLMRMQTAMVNCINNLWEKRDSNIDKIIKTKEDAIVLASIVEEEAKTEEDRALIASVFLNRLAINMPLQADPTVLFAVNKNLSSAKARLSHKDLRVQSPFNTYLNTGLPPEPISNPGLNSIKAVLNPIAADFLYFVVGSCDGKHIFAKDLCDHNKNVVAYRSLKCP